MQEHRCDRRPDGDFVVGSANIGLCRRSLKRAVEVRYLQPESMAHASHQLHDYRILFVFGESVEEAEALSLKSMTLPRRSGIDHE